MAAIFYNSLKSGFMYFLHTQRGESFNGITLCPMFKKIVSSSIFCQKKRKLKMASTIEIFRVGMFFLNTLRVENLVKSALSCLVEETVLMLTFLWQILNFKMVTIFYKTSAAVYIPCQHMHDNFIININCTS